MGLTSASTGVGAIKEELFIKSPNPNEKIVAIAGNPNVGKSTLFNALTGLKQHTGNWPGKTVCNAKGFCKGEKNSYVLVDIPGTYSLFAHSPEEEVARNFVCFGEPDAIVIVCDGTCLERNLNLVIQTLEICKNAVVCVNLLDEAKRKGIKIDLELLSERLGVPVVGTVARKKKTLCKLVNTLDNLTEPESSFIVTYPKVIENAINIITPSLEKNIPKPFNLRWLALRVLEGDEVLLRESSKYLNVDILNCREIAKALKEALQYLEENHINRNVAKDFIASQSVELAEKISQDVILIERKGYELFDRKIDKILTGKKFGYPLMLLLLLGVFWLTITGANYLSEYLSSFFALIETGLNKLLTFFNAPDLLRQIVIEGIFRVPAWVVSVMLPPMAIFFPLFTLLEDSGYLPRVAYNLDKPFKHCNSCGKQALTMCMGFGCNAAGVVGCRIIDSKRERLLAIITNSLVPCNGRFPAIIAIISMFFITSGNFYGKALSAVLVTLVILTGVLMTFLSTKLLSSTVLKGVPSAYTLELPPYRRPKIGSVIVRSVFDRTLFVLGRSLSVAIPAGMIIWLMANVRLAGATLLTHSAEFLDPLGRLMGLDGVILLAFILGFPANEIVLPIALMVYLSGNTLTDTSSISAMQSVLVANGWNGVTAICTIIFSLFHWPCSTTLLTIKKETGSLKWALFSFIFPTLIGVAFCIIINLIFLI